MSDTVLKLGDCEEKTRSVLKTIEEKLVLRRGADSVCTSVSVLVGPVPHFLWSWQNQSRWERALLII